MAFHTLEIDIADALHLPGVRDSKVDGEKELTLTWFRENGASTAQKLKHSGKTTFTFTPIPPDTERVQVEVLHPDYVPQRVMVRLPSQGAVDWNNPVCRVDAQGQTVKLLILLGRIRQAPGELTPQSGKTKGDKAGVFTNRVQNMQRYNGLDLRPVGRLNMLEDHPTTQKGSVQPAVSVLDNADADEWKRFFTKEMNGVDIESKSGFLWLEYGSLSTQRLNEPRFLIALWAPEQPNPAPKEGLDYLVFYSPITRLNNFPETAYPFRKQYPYSVTPNTVIQPYLNLGYRYLLGAPLFAHQAMASGKPPVMIMPIFPNTQDIKDMWQPFNSQAGLYRLILEVALFLHQEGYNRGGTGFGRWNGRTTQIGGVASPEFPPQTFSSQPGSVPLARNVTIAGFSSSSRALYPFLNRDAIEAPSRYRPEVFGAPAAEFQERWREFWLLDFHINEKDTKIPRKGLEDRLLDWLSRGRERRLRLYQSGYTFGGGQPGTVYPNLEKLPRLKPPEHRQKIKDAATWAEEWRDPNGRWSMLFLSSNYVRNPTATVDLKPVFPMLSEDLGVIHPFVASISFGHACKLRFDK